MKSAANIISVIRILLVLSLLLVKPLGTAFAVIYTAAGLSDMLDGYIARKTNTTSKLGEKLDSAADLIMVGVVMGLLLPVIKVPVPIIIWVALIAALRFVSMGVVFAKYHTFQILHTYGNKLTGLLLFVYPLFLVFLPSDVPAVLICTAASLSAAEELLIHLFSKELQANRKSLFVK